MSRDGRGNPGLMTLKNQPRLRLADLLRRRRMTLRQFLSEFGITTYEALCIRCRRMGVVAHSQEEFEQVIPAIVHVNSPTEGVVVLEPPPVIAEQTGQPLDVDLPAWQLAGFDDPSSYDEYLSGRPEGTPPEPTEAAQKRPRRKKEASPVG